MYDLYVIVLVHPLVALVGAHNLSFTFHRQTSICWEGSRYEHMQTQE